MPMRVDIVASVTKKVKCVSQKEHLGSTKVELEDAIFFWWYVNVKYLALQRDLHSCKSLIWIL